MTERLRLNTGGAMVQPALASGAESLLSCVAATGRRVMVPAALLRSVAIALCASAVSPALGQTVEERGISDVLVGNSIIHPDFGCVHYPDSRRSLIYVGDMRREGEWSVRGGLFYSSGQCGKIGCRVTGSIPNIVFERLDGGYTQSAMVMKGDYCKKDGIIS